MDETGRIPMRVTFDHRVLDGAPVARAMAEMEDILLGPVLDEMRAMAVQPALDSGKWARYRRRMEESPCADSPWPRA